MEIEEIYNVTISPSITSKYAVEWSKDNHISVLTDRGIHMFELIPSPMSSCSTMKFSRSFIYTPSTLPTENISSKLESKIWSMNREALYSFIMEDSLTPKLSNTKEMVPKITALSWSPQNLIHPSKCLVAILTSAGAVTIAFKISKNWYIAHDLSDMRYNIMDQEITTKLKKYKSNSVSFETLRSCLKMLQASCFVWSKLFVDFAYFAAAYYNGDIIVYKISRITKYNEISNPKIVGTIKLDKHVKINVLHWITLDTKEHLIIVGYFDGCIYGLKIKEHHQTLELKSIEKYYNYADRTPISAIKTFPEDYLNIMILIAKGSFIFLLRLTIDSTLKSMEYLQLEGFTISGMTCISKDCALVTTENGSMFTVNIEEGHLSKTKINNKLSQGNLRYLGIAHSPNTVIFINVTSPTVHDHLVVKEPSKMYLFCLKNEKWDPLLILKQRKQKTDKSVYLWDCLEMLRIKATKATDPSTVFPSVPSNLESLSLHELQIVMWITVMIEICDKKTVVQGISNITGEISDAQPLIFVYTACDYLTRLEGKSSLSEEQKLSVSLLRQYLNLYLTERNNKETTASNRIMKVLKKTSRFDLDNTETCSLCSKTMNDHCWTISKCPQGHILPRCAITLLQITTVQYKTCPICGLIFHSCLEEEFSETRCLFCNVPALDENRMLQSKCHISMQKSLSKLGSNILELSEDKEMETAADES